MIDCKICKQVLTIGLDWRRPRGGMAQVLNTYATIYKPFNFIATSKGDMSPVYRYVFALCSFFKLILTLLWNKEIKVVHIHSASGKSFYRKSIAILIASLFRKKIVFHCHGGGFKEFRESHKKYVDFIINKCIVIVCLSQYWKEYFQNTYSMKTMIVNNPISTPKFIETRKDEKCHILFLGLICNNKGIYDVLEAISKHKNELKDLIILHVGGNGETEILNQRILDLGLEDIVRFEGWVDKEKKIYLMNLCDIFLLPSYIEGVPISILEAESYKNAIITTNVGGIPSIVKDGGNGIFVTPGSIEDIYKAILKLSSSHDTCKELGENGYKISQDYLSENVASQLTSLYLDIISNK